MRLDGKIRYDVCRGKEFGYKCPKQGVKVPIAHQGKCLCVSCNTQRRQAGAKHKEQQPKARYKIANQSAKGKLTSKLDDVFFRSIWNARPHFSEISGQPLGDVFSATFCSHIHTKAARPDLRYDKRNILLMTPEEHHEWETGWRNGGPGNMPEAFKVKFKKALDLFDKLSEHGG